MSKHIWISAAMISGFPTEKAGGTRSIKGGVPTVSGTPKLKFKVKVKQCMSDLKEIQDGINPMGKPRLADKLQEDLNNGTFKGQHKVDKLTKSTHFENVKSAFISQLLKNLDKRFPGTDLMTAFSALALRPIAFLSDAELLTWGNDSIDVLTKFYGEEQTHTYKDPVTKEIHTYTSPPKIEVAKVKEEWQQLKAVVKQQQYPKDCMNTLYRIITECHPGQFQQIIYLASLALTHPIHTADCERAFSTLAFLVYRFAKARKKVFHFRDKHNKDIHLVNSAEEWDAVYPLLSEHCQTVKVVGFDCEWVFWGMRLPVALIQIATQDGLCLLVRIFQFSDNIPQTLKDFLSDKSILKVGISAKDDGNKLFTDYGMIVNGCVDLRFLLGRVRGFTCKSLGLQGLAEGVLRVNMVKDRNIRCGDWEAECLSNEQIDYAADDALIAVDIFMHLVSVKIHGREQRKLFYGCSAEIDPTSFWKVARSFCQGIVDMPFKNQKTNLLPLNGKVLSDDDYEGTGEDDDDDNDNTESYEQPGTSSKGRQPVLKPGRLKDGKKAFMARKRPLYYNCRILAPDGSCLTTCDIRKAEWYIAKELADKVNTEEGAPLTIKLRFQPSGKPGSDRDYYLQDKDNVCVVCGKEEDYVRKLVVPKEYRKYFPSLMKDHSSHDVLLLCITCHLQSAVYEGLLRQQLAMECGAPLDSGKDSKRMQDQDLAKVVSASKALLTSKNKIPEQRLIELENIVKNYYGVEHLTEDLLHRAVEIDFTVHNSKFVPHGKKVVDFYMNKDGGLLEFEKMWRRNFVETMKPQFLPKMWSIEHRPEKMTTNTEYNASDFLKDTVDQ